tara:strand:- start:60706 stop:61479 length:774 start_codon:yes stop_codon:yes gene_type:complete
MKIRLLFILWLSLFIISCSDDSDIVIEPVAITLNFSHAWQDTEITNADFNDVKFTNANGEQLSIERLRYLISEIILTHESGVVTTLDDYTLVDVTNGENLSLTTSATILPGNYTSISFRFGFSDTNNTDGIYQDLNTASFNVPGILGGGYHYMQFDGKYLDTNNAEAPFNYHAIRAVDNTDPNNLTFQDTSFQVSLGAIIVGGNTNVNVQMDVYEWFSSPNTWDLNVLNTVLMPNSAAQVLMSQNGVSVFSLVDIIQ